MWHHFIHLLGHSWKAMTGATSTSTLGFVLWTLAMTAIGWFAPIAGTWLKLRHLKHLRPFRQALHESFWSSIFLGLGVVALVGLTFVGFIVRTVFVEHEAFVTQNQNLRADNANLQRDLQWRKDHVSTTDAVFPNLIYMLQAFRSFRADMNGTPCVLYVSAPKETAALASVMVQLAGPDSGCWPIGPLSGDNPDLDPELTKGMVPEAIVVHAAKGEKAADGLFSTLGNQIHLERSYRLLRNPKERWASRYQGKEHLVS